MSGTGSGWNVRPSIRREKHKKDEEFCNVYYRHFHLGSLALWLNPWWW